MSTEIRIALVFQQDDGTQALRTALANAGVVIAAECRASALDPTAIFASQVDAIVVNLDAELEELLDEVTEALDSASQPVIYNDPAASSDLSGWDRARWMRHLAAKLKGQSNVTPPPPPGAQAIPMPLARVAAVGTVSDSAPAQPEAAPEVGLAEVVLGESVPELKGEGGDMAFDLGLADLDLMFEAPVAASPASAPVASEAHREEIVASVGTPAAEAIDMPFDLGLGDLDAMFDAPAAVAPSAAQSSSESLTIGDDLGDIDALFSESPAVSFGDDTPAPAAPAQSSVAELELEALFSETTSTPPVEPLAPTATAAELTDLDALFREFESSQASAPAATDKAAQPTPVAAAPAVEAKGAPLDWSLEPLHDLTLDELEAGGPVSAPKGPAASAPKAASGPSIPAALEASLALADLKLLDDEDIAPAHAAQQDELEPLESLDLGSIDLDTLEPAPPARAAVDLGDELSLADLDFALDLEPPSSAGPEPAAANLQMDSDLGDLDALFEPMAEAPLLGLMLPDLERVYVLGASIGGPEAIKAFLSKLPAAVPAAFIVAQHMGGEFLQMMATQLDAATPLSVRCPKAGERLRHGEVIVAPAGEQLSIDESGRVQLSAASSGSPYNPSIDQLVRDAANRFGDHATLILFSGMGTDAVEGGRYLAARGGQVWAQDRSTCVIASMIDSAKSQGLIRFEGTPEQLAERVLQVVS